MAKKTGRDYAKCSKLLTWKRKKKSSPSSTPPT